MDLVLDGQTKNRERYGNLSSFKKHIKTQERDIA